MTNTSNVEWPIGTPIFELMFAALSEAHRSNGVTSGLKITPTANAMELQMGTGEAHHDGKTHSVSTAQTATVSTADATYDRWDTVVYDTSGTDSGLTIKAGTAGTTSAPPMPDADDIILAMVYVPAGVTDIDVTEIYNWRIPGATDALDVKLDDAAANYTATNIEDAFSEAVTKFYDVAGDSLSGTMDVSANNIIDGTITLYDATAGHFPRDVLDVLRDTTTFAATSTTSAIATTGDELILVDSSSAAATVTLSSADATSGRCIGIIDVGGASGTNAITIDTEGTETIDGASSKSISTNYGSQEVVSDGTNWFTAGGGGGGGTGVDVEDGSAGTIVAGATAIDFATGLDAVADGDGTATVNTVGVNDPLLVTGEGSGTIASGNVAPIAFCSLPAGDTLTIDHAALINVDGTPAATGLDLIIATLPNDGTHTSQGAILAGDGTAVLDDETTFTTASYTNGTTSAQTVAIMIDNGTTASVDAFAFVRANK